jgi:hypothetical protein
MSPSPIARDLFPVPARPRRVWHSTIKLRGKVAGDTIKGEIEIPSFNGDGGTETIA